MTAVPWYLGDLAPVFPQPLLGPPAIGPLYRYNFNMRNSLRAHAVFYELAGSGEIFGGTEAEFQSSFVDLGLDFEFNWWPYKTASRKTKYSPYVSAGLGYSLNYAGGSSIAPLPALRGRDEGQPGEKIEWRGGGEHAKDLYGSA